MTTVPQEYMTSENKEVHPNSPLKESTIFTQDFTTTETSSLNEETSQADASLSHLNLEETTAHTENDDNQRETKELISFSDCKIQTKPRKILIVFFKKIFTCCFEIVCIFFSMINSDINSMLDTCSAVLGISQERINKKLLKQLVLFAIIIVSLVHSRNEGVYQNFETQRLFSRHSLVTDFFQGELSILNEEMLESDLTVVMYYAPWDRQSQNFAPYFLKAAQYHHEQVSFAAINCWLPKSECRAHYKLNYYPVVVLHVRLTSFDESLTIPYNGPHSAHHLIRFISRALRPFTYISSQAELLAAQLENQVIALGYYDIGNFNREFVDFYFAAISKLQFEHMSEVRYGLITNPTLAKQISFTHRPSIHLMTWNATLEFPKYAKKNLRNITNFIDVHLSEVVQWLHVSGKKSLALNSVFQEGPFMAVFTPDNPYHSSNDPFQLIRSIALEYFNCHQSTLQTWLADHFHFETRAQLKHSDKICRDYLKKHLDSGSSSLLNSLHNDEKFEEIENCKSESDLSICEIEESSLLRPIEWKNLWSYFTKSEPLLPSNHCFKSSSPFSCKNKNESSNEKNTMKYNQWEKMEEHAIKGPMKDDRVSKLTDWVSEEHCKRLALGSRVAPSLTIKEKGERVRINGLSCKTNRTLKFIAIDSLLHQDFAQQLGINLSNRSPKYSGGIIIDPVMEERYVMNQPLSRNNMASFVQNFTNSFLNRAKIEGKAARKRKDIKPGQVSIFELYSNNYVKVVNKPREAFVVLHYSHHCGACSVIGSVLLTCQHLTSEASNLTFARIDVSKNTMPWHLTFDTVPTIIFYPHDNKSESKIFNSQLPINVKNLMTFILSGLKPPERNSLASKLCDAKCKKGVTAQSLVMKLKLHHSISVTSSRLKRCIASLILFKDQRMKDENNLMLQSKYLFILELKSKLNNKLMNLKSKLSYLNQLGNFFPHVPSQFPNQFAYDTKSMFKKANSEL